MSIVIHEINGNLYAYNHWRDGDKVITDYLYPVGDDGRERSAIHGGGAPVINPVAKKQIATAPETAPIRIDGRMMFQPTDKQEAKWNNKPPAMPSDDEFKAQWKKSHRGKVAGWGLGKRQWVVSSWGMTRNYQVGMWQGRVDKANKLDYHEERKDKAYNIGYNLGYTEYESNRRGWDNNTSDNFDSKYVNQSG